MQPTNRGELIGFLEAWVPASTTIPPGVFHWAQGSFLQLTTRSYFELAPHRNLDTIVSRETLPGQ
jgi:hypothetical protein